MVTGNVWGVSETLSAGRAAAVAGVSRQAVVKAIVSGRLNGTRRADGTYEVDAESLNSWRPGSPTVNRRPTHPPAGPSVSQPTDSAVVVDVTDDAPTSQSQPHVLPTAPRVSPPGRSQVNVPGGQVEQLAAQVLELEAQVRELTGQVRALVLARDAFRSSTLTLSEALEKVSSPPGR